MTDTETITNESTPSEPQPEPDPIEVIHQGECPSLSGRSVLTYAIGRHPDGTLHLAIVGNSGNGMWFDGWASAVDIEGIVRGSSELTAKSFHVLHQGRSVNTGGFVLATLKHLGLIRTNAENTRHHEFVPSLSFEKVVMALMGQAAPQKSRRKKEA